MEEVKKVSLNQIETGPIRHRELSEELISRIRLIRAALLGVYPHSMNHWLDGFKRDAHPDKEVLRWEHIAACYLEYISTTKGITKEQCGHVFTIILGLCSGQKKNHLKEHFAFIPSEDLEKIITSKLPPYDFKDEKFISR